MIKSEQWEFFVEREGQTARFWAQKGEEPDGTGTWSVTANDPGAALPWTELECVLEILKNIMLYETTGAMRKRPRYSPPNVESSYA